MTTNRKSDIAAFLQRWHLSHPLLALGKMAPFLLASLAYPPAVWIGVAVAISFYYGREVAHVGAALPDNRWWEGYDVTRWKRDNHLDFWPVVGMALAAAVLAVMLSGCAGPWSLWTQTGPPEIEREDSEDTGPVR